MSRRERPLGGEGMVVGREEVVAVRESRRVWRSSEGESAGVAIAVTNWRGWGGWVKVVRKTEVLR